MSLCIMSLCTMSLCTMSFCIMSLCTTSLCPMSFVQYVFVLHGFVHHAFVQHVFVHLAFVQHVFMHCVFVHHVFCALCLSFLSHSLTYLISVWSLTKSLFSGIQVRSTNRGGSYYGCGVGSKKEQREGRGRSLICCSSMRAPRSDCRSVS